MGSETSKSLGYTPPLEAPTNAGYVVLLLASVYLRNRLRYLGPQAGNRIHGDIMAMMETASTIPILAKPTDRSTRPGTLLGVVLTLTLAAYFSQRMVTT